MARTSLKPKRAPVRDVLANVERTSSVLTGPFELQSALTAADYFGHPSSLTWRVDNLAEPSHGIEEEAKTLRAGVGLARVWPDGQGLVSFHLVNGPGTA